MSPSSSIPIWDPSACVPRDEVITGELTDAELALRLGLVVAGNAKAPYDNPRSFFESTHKTRNMAHIIEYVFGRLGQSRKDVNPVVVLDVGFGGGKTHTLVALYYAARFGNLPDVKEHLGGIDVPDDVNVVTMSGEEYGGAGVTRKGRTLATMWGDLFYQLGTYQDKYQSLDEEWKVPELNDMKRALGTRPVLVLLDELPTYLRLLADDDPRRMNKAVQFVQRLVLAVAEKENAAMVVAIAEDAYKEEASMARKTIEDTVIRAMEEARAHIRRKEIVMAPVEEGDVVHILKRRLFSSINQGTAKATAEAYSSMYSGIAVPDEYKKATFRDEIVENYPFHPHLITVLYERLATMDRFQRTRGALRLLSRIVRRIWREKEADALLIHPFHVDFAEDGIVDDLTEGVGEGKLRNAVEADIWRRDGGAVAQLLDEDIIAHWKGPLHRRTANTVFLYSLAASKEGTKGIDAEHLVAMMATPERSDHALRVRDSVLKSFVDEFSFIDRKGTHYQFIREPQPLRIIDKEARNVTDGDATDVVRKCLANLFSDQPGWIHVEIFPLDPSRLADDPTIKMAILNPNLHHVIPDSGDVPDNVVQFLQYKDAQGKRFRKFKNDTFLLVAEHGRLQSLWNTAKKLFAAREVRKNLVKYGIPKDRKEDVEGYFSDQEKYINDYVRSAFCKILNYDKKGDVKVIGVNPMGYSGGKGGKAMFSYHLRDVFHRVIEKPLDPAYVESDAWPADAAYVSTQHLLEAFHGVSGLVIPTTQTVFKDTVKRGIDEGNWVLRQDGKVFTREKMPGAIHIDTNAEVWVYDEAKKNGLLDTTEAPQKGPTPVKKGKPTAKRPKGPMPFNHSFLNAPAETLAGDLEKWSKKHRIKGIDEVIIKSEGSPATLFSIRNLLTRLKPEKSCKPSLKINTRKYSNPGFTINTDLKGDDFDDATAKTVLDAISRLGSVDIYTCDLTLAWEDATVDRVAQALRGLSQLDKDVAYSLTISGIKEGG